MEKKQVFDGIKVADFTWSIAGPMATRELAEHGATVVRVESHKYPCPMRRAGSMMGRSVSINGSFVFANFNTNKLGISLDLSKPRGQEAARRLVKWADIVGESFGPGVIARFGLDYESVRKIKPDIIYFSTSLQGQYGPHSRYQAWGWQAASLAGFYETVGWPDRLPTGIPGAYTDQIAPYYTVCALVAALDYRRRTGKGMYLDQAQFEVGVTFAEPSLLDYGVNGRILKRRGNRDPYAAPHGSYRCHGDDSWCVIAVATDQDWQAFCEVIGNPPWTKEPSFATLPARKENENELDRLVEEWTVRHSAPDVMRMMQAKGVPAGVVQKNEDLFNDPQLRHRASHERLNHPELGTVLHQKPAYRLSGTPCQLVSTGPYLGEHNEYVCKEILGFSDDEIADMLIEGAITTEADMPGAR
jgi:benzylsuccinate CoA-transferase BbsF subunit